MPAGTNMDIGNAGEGRLTNGVDAFHTDLHQQNERKNEQESVMMNGYYGYIAHYEHAGSDTEEESAMDVGHAEYAINGPPTCILVRVMEKYD